MSPNISSWILHLKFLIKYFLSAAHKEEYDIFRNQKKCYVFLAADYGNLGDVAITFSQELFLKSHFPNYVIVDVPISKTLSDLKAIKNSCSSGDIITIVGGGNMSDLYFDIEMLRQMVINRFRTNRVISFPQTISYSSSKFGRCWQNKSVRCYSSHKDLLLMARENKSYRQMCALYHNRVECLPDIVMLLNKTSPDYQRSGVTLCLRDDIEKALESSFKTQLKTKLLDIGLSFSEQDTHIGREGLSLEEREKELNAIWDVFKHSAWVITDRLHGMIFSFITKTPCIVLPNNNFKVEQCYDWIRECGYVFFLKDIDVNLVINILSKEVVDNFYCVHQQIVKKFSQVFL